MMKSLCFALAAAIGAAGLAACERPATNSSATIPSPTQAAPATTPTAPANESAATASSVQSASSDAITDSVITAKIKAGILSDPGMTGADVSVNTDRGVVSLAGIVKSQEQAAIASAHAQRQDGVMRVDNQLSLNSQ